MQVIPNSGMVSTMDIGSRDFIHPPKKEEVGKRLAYWALAKEYGVDNLGYKTPVYKSMEVKEGKVYIAFDNAQGKVHPINRPLSSFEIAGKDRKFYPAEAIVDWQRNNFRFGIKRFPNRWQCVMPFIIMRKLPFSIIMVCRWHHSELIMVEIYDNISTNFNYNIHLVLFYTGKGAR